MIDYSGLIATADVLRHMPGKHRQKTHGKESAGSAGWKPSMSEKEAAAWAKDSKIKTTLFHGTGTSEKGIQTPASELKSRINDIKENGFKLQTTTNGRQLGNGVYFSDSRQKSKRYGEVLEVKINVKNPYVTTQLEWFKQYKRIQREVKKEGLFKKLSPVERLNWWAKKHNHDAIQITDASRQLVVFDPKNVVVIQ